MWHLIEQLLPLFPFLGMLWSPCCCSPGCQFFSDDFAVDDLATNYTSVSGSWSIGSGVLSIASSNAVLTGNTANPNSDSNTKISVTVNIATSGDIARIILAYQNSSNYWFAEVKAGTGAYLRIYQRSGGSNTQKATVSITRAAGSFAVCASVAGGTSFSVSASGYSLAYTDTFTNTGWGLGTGTIAGTVTFDDLIVTKVDANCASCGTCLANCSGGVGPDTFKMELSGTLDIGTNCPSGLSTCVNWDGTYYLPATGLCIWLLVYNNSTFCSPSGPGSTGFGSKSYSVEWTGAAFEGLLDIAYSSTQRARFAAPNASCSSWSHTQFTFSSQAAAWAATGPGNLCDASSATMYITAV